jgi:hypothetical protein
VSVDEGNTTMCFDGKTVFKGKRIIAGYGVRGLTSYLEGQSERARAPNW